MGYFNDVFMVLFASIKKKKKKTWTGPALYLNETKQQTNK